MNDKSNGGEGLSRRAFLSWRSVSARPLGPPPPCIAGPDTSANACVDCVDQPCVGVCEPDVIRIHPRDHALPGRAYVSFETAGCTFCGACHEACPATSMPAPRPPRPLGLALLSRDDCLAWNDVLCSSCRNACDWSAIDLDAERRPTVAYGDCTGCGRCIPVCPTHAITIR